MGLAEWQHNCIWMIIGFIRDINRLNLLNHFEIVPHLTTNPIKIQVADRDKTFVVYLARAQLLKCFILGVWDQIQVSPTYLADLKRSQ